MISRTRLKGAGATIRRRALLGILILVVGALGLWLYLSTEEAKSLQDRISEVERVVTESEKDPPTPWLVVETQLQRGSNGFTLTISYVDPGGDTRTWWRDIRYSIGEENRPWVDALVSCWQLADLESTLPQCIRSEY